MTILRVNKFILFVAINLLLVCSNSYGSGFNAELGIAVTPKNFPQHSAQDMDDAFALAGNLAKYSVFIFQWRELDIHIVRHMMKKSAEQNLIPILGLSPTTLDQGRKELDIPVWLRKQSRGPISFSNPKIESAFIKAAERLAKLHPKYLCLATEINFLALQNLKEYLHFVRVYKNAYKRIKKISPNTKTFVSFQWEWIRILDAKEMHRIKEHSQVIKIFQPQLDLVALTTYPSAFHKKPSELPMDYFSWIHRHIDKKEEILFMEVGWPTSGSGTLTEQKDFVQKLPTLLKNLNVSILAWALLHDVNLNEFDANLNSVGIISTDGKKKPAYKQFQDLNIHK